MIVLDTCYFCTSPYQLFSILSLADERKEAADLYIDPQFPDAEKFAERIIELGLFQSVTVIDSEAIYEEYIKTRSGIINHFQIANTYIHVKEVGRKILGKDVRYNNIFVSTKAYIPRMVQLYHIKMGWIFNSYYFDDGCGTYEGDRSFNAKGADIAIRRLLFGKRSINIRDKQFVLSLEVFKQLNKDFDMETELIHGIWENKEGIDKINRVFDANELSPIKEKLIILGTCHKDLFDDKSIERLYQVYDDFVEKIGPDKTILKKHPRESEGGYSNRINHFDHNGIPFEVYSMNSDMNDKIILAHSSTAAITPKLLFGQEPVVILLCRLFPIQPGGQIVFNELFQVIKNTYSDPERFLIPENMQELERIIDLL